MASRSRRLGTALAVAVAVLGACSDGPRDLGAGLLLATPPEGYALGPAGSDQVMSLDTAAQASVAETAAKKERLSELGYRGGHSRLWVDGSAHVSAVVYGFGTPEGAEGLVTYEVGEAKTYAGSYTFAVPSVPGAHGYVISGSRRDGRASLFCHSVWFARDRYAFNVNDCGERPGSPARVLQLAEEQEAQADLGDDG